MAERCWRLLAIFALILIVPVLARTQDFVYERPLVQPGRFAPPLNLSTHSPVPSGIFSFQKIVGAAGIIFSGRVTAVGRLAGQSGQSPASTTLTFRVDQAIRGTSSGKTLTIREWAGLWDRGERYRVGERVMLFLYPPGKLGLTSPESAAMGRFAIDSRGRVALTPQHLVAFQADPILGRRSSISFYDLRSVVLRLGRAQ